MSAGTSDNRAGWATVSPALLWTILFFAVPFIVMASISFTVKAGGISLANYQQFSPTPAIGAR